MFYVVVSDLDGTLLTFNNQLTSFTKKILRLLSTINVHFIFATGRNYANVSEVRNDLNIYDYIITSNGASIYNSDDKLIISYSLNPEIVYDLLNIIDDDQGVIINIFHQDGKRISQYKKYRNFFLLQGFFRNHEICKKQSLCFDSISKICFTSSNYQQLFLLEKKINVRWGANVNVSFSLPTCLEVVSGGVSKGYALEKIIDLLGYTLKDCISFGDGMNDYEMLSMTGKGCIMYNAQQRLKDTLPLLEVIGSNKIEAVPHYLKCMYFR